MKPAARTALAAVSLLCVPVAASAQPRPYLLDTGDTIEMDVYGMPDFKRRMPVDVDGDVSLPFAGSVHAAGLSLADLRVAIASALSLGISVAFLVCGSRVSAAELRAASHSFPLGVEVVAIICDPDAVPGLRRVAGLSVLTIGYLDDLRVALQRTAAVA